MRPKFISSAAVGCNLCHHTLIRQLFRRSALSLVFRQLHIAKIVATAAMVKWQIALT